MHNIIVHFYRKKTKQYKVYNGPQDIVNTKEDYTMKP